jgi:hypothetical protein
MQTGTSSGLLIVGLGLPVKSRRNSKVVLFQGELRTIVQRTKPPAI